MSIRIRGARAHNLKNVDLDLPRGQLTVMTGVSGSGKSSLAFDTLFAEGQRRYVESLSAYARQFLGQLDKPDVDSIDGLSPAISIDQKSTSHNPRSTVGTVTEIHDFLRLMYARLGQPHCPKCHKPIKGQTLDEILDQMEALAEGTRYLLLAPLVRTRKGEHKELLEEAQKEGFARVRIDGSVRDLSEEIQLDKKKAHDVDLVVDRLVARPGLRSRLADSVSTALKKGNGTLVVAPTEGKELIYSEHHGCPDCGISLEEISPRSFSFNSPYGACATCHGLGAKSEVDPFRIINPKRSLKGGAIIPWAKSGNPYFSALLIGVAKVHGIDLEIPFGSLPAQQQALILKGSPDKIWVDQESWYSGRKGYETRFEGVLPHLNRRYQESTSETFRQELETYMTSVPCHACQGRRLKETSLAVLMEGRSIADVSALSLRDAQAFVGELRIPERLRPIGDPILKEVSARLAFLVDVGLDYLSLDRSANTLSGGEAQRIRLATQIGSGLVGVLYILDEPSIGLHQRDNDRLLKTLLRLRDMGNTLVVVEHDEETIRAADYLVDIGPLAGQHGGEIVAVGSREDLMAEARSLTGDYLSGRKSIAIPRTRRPGNGQTLQLVGATRNNLKGIDVAVPLGCFISVSGVSGSGKSTLINELLGTHLAHGLGSPLAPLAGLQALKGFEAIDKLVNIDQSPIGRTPRSNPATYTGLFDHLREAFSLTPEAKTRGYKAGRFSFNIKGGRCEACKGEGTITIEMHFLPDVYVPCEICLGKRYNRETLEVRYKGKTISDVLDMTVEEALEHFKHLPKAKSKLQTLFDVGLDYIKLGQPATTLSGGEAQRIKLASELSRRSTGRTMYILDEPTTGLHFHDIAKLLEVLQRLVDLGNTVIVIEHNLDVIKVSDHVIDMGPEGGDRGGRLIAEGTPEAVAESASSHTGRFLKRLLPAKPERIHA